MEREITRSAKAMYRPRRAVDARNSVDEMEGSGAGEGIRTLDPNLGKVVLYP